MKPWNMMEGHSLIKKLMSTKKQKRALVQVVMVELHRRESKEYEGLSYLDVEDVFAHGFVECKVLRKGALC
jgi:hypothetical protein